MGGKQITGMALHGTTLEWCTLRLAGDRSEETGPKEATLELGESPTGILEAIQADRARVVAELKSRCGGIPGAVALGIPASWALVRVLGIPAATPEEIHGIVELQVDKFSPFPVENMVVTQEVLHEAEGRARVLVAAVRNETVEALGGVFRDAGIPLARVDINTLGWWHLIREIPGAVHTLGRQLFILLDGSECDFLMTHNGIPVLFRSVGPLASLSPEECVDEITREATATLSSLEAEFGGQLGPVSFWHRPPEPTDLIQRLRTDLGLEVHPTSLQTLAPLCHGLSARSALPAGGTINLAPPAWRQSEQELATRHRILAASIATLALWVLALLVLWGGLYFQRQKLASMQARINSLSGRAQEVRATQARVNSLQQYNDRTRSAIECLLEVTRSLPPEGIELKSFTYHKGKAVELSGTASAVTIVYDFKKALDDSKLFTGIELGRISTGSDGRVVFKMTCKLPGGGTE